MSGEKGELAGGAVCNRLADVKDCESGRKNGAFLAPATAALSQSDDADSPSPDVQTKKRRRLRLKVFRRFVQRALHFVVPTHESRSKGEQQHQQQQPPRGSSDDYGGAGRRGNERTFGETALSRRVLDPNAPTPGVAGLSNHGNTCFMNAVLQCLNNTDSLAEYFVMDLCKSDMEAKRQARRSGGCGEVTEQLAVLMKSLWSCCYTPRVTAELKQLIGRQAPQYRGYAQHDAQEFLLWILDKVHEDLNRVVKKKYCCLKDVPGRPDHEIAAEALANHRRCNDSFVSDLFQAQYRSELTCPVCHQRSVTFDPFLCISLPLPQCRKMAIDVTVVYRDHDRADLQLVATVDVSRTIEDLRMEISRLASIPFSFIVLTEVYDSGFDRTFFDTNSVSTIREGDNIVAFEARYQKSKSSTRSLASLVSTSSAGSRRSSSVRETLLILLIHQLFDTDNAQSLFGSMSVLRVYRDISFLDLQTVILKLMAKHLRGGEVTQTMKQTLMLRLSVVDGVHTKSYLPHDLDHPLFTTIIDRAKALCTPGGGPSHVKMMVEWSQQLKSSLLAAVPIIVPQEHDSVSQIKQALYQPDEVKLEECFHLYTSEERLGSSDSWYCPNCRQHQQGTVKRLSLWTLPEVLVIHLKRFKQVSSMRRTKLHTLVKFPITDLDMTSHVEGGSPTGDRVSEGDENIYDLYAVCNHHGGMAGGHYTAFCLNPVSNQWHSYDDQFIQPLKESAIISRGAYILFYIKRNPNSANTAKQFQHWVDQMPQFNLLPETAVKESGNSNASHELVESAV